MDKLQKIGTLQVDQDSAFQKRNWRAQRVGWWGIALVLLASLLGVFGYGPLSSVSQSDAGATLRLDYERFLRVQSDAELSIQVRPDAKHPAEIALWVNRDYLNAFRVQQITPLPERTQVAPDRVILFFTVAGQNQPSANQQAVEISFQLSALQMGWVSGTIGLENGPTLHFWHFVYP